MILRTSIDTSSCFLRKFKNKKNFSTSYGNLEVISPFPRPLPSKASFRDDTDPAKQDKHFGLS